MGDHIQHKQPDGTLVFGRKHGTGKHAVLIIPGFGETIFHSYHDRLAKHVLTDEFTVYVVELRGHKLSRGKWSLGAYRADITYWIAHLKKKHKKLFVIASGLSASTMLEYDDQAHTFTDFPPLPDGMLLFSPVFNGSELLPHLDTLSRTTKKVLPRMTKTLLGKAISRRYPGVRPYDAVRVWYEIASYTLHPVRIQTPTVLLVPIDETADPLKRIFGKVKIRKTGWLHVRSRAGIAHHLQELGEAFEQVHKSEKPIRFRSVH